MIFHLLSLPTPFTSSTYIFLFPLHHYFHSGAEENILCESNSIDGENDFVHEFGHTIQALIYP